MFQEIYEKRPSWMVLEQRKTSPKKIAGAAMTGIAVGVCYVGFVAPLLSRLNTTEYRIGETVSHPAFGTGVIREIDSHAETAHVEFPETTSVVYLDKLTK